MTELKPCPFCGFSDWDHPVYPETRERDVWSCECENPDCGARITLESKEKVIEAIDT